MSDAITEQENLRIAKLYEDQLFLPCETKEQLNEWIITFCNVVLPNYTLDPNSNSNPLDFIWDVYSSAKSGNKKRNVFVVAASRACMKTLAISILEFVLMCHFGKTIVHLAAIIDQSLACIGYLDNFLSLPSIKKYSKKDASRAKVLKKVPTNKYNTSPNSSLKVIVATSASANGQRGNVMCYDEVDLIEEHILNESAMVADPDHMSRMPIFIYVSSRKSATGPVQKKIDQWEAGDTTIIFHKWSLLDFMKPCLPETHLPHLPKINLYIHRESLRVIDDSAYQFLDVTMAGQYTGYKAFEGCRNCKAFIVCRALAPNQKSQNSRALRDIEFVGSILRQTESSEKISAQLLNLRPESGGIIFNKFNDKDNVKNLRDAYMFAFNVYPEDDNKPNLTLAEFAHELRENDWFFTCGTDFGYVDPAISMLIAHSKKMEKTIILHTLKSSGFSNRDWLIYTKEHIFEKYGFNLLCPDLADKSSPSEASKLKMPCRSKKPHKIESGIDWLRNQIFSPSRQEALLIVLDTEANKPVITSFKKYEYKKGPMGYLTDVYDEDSPYSHEMDALRYGVDIYVTKNDTNISVDQVEAPVPTNLQEMKDKIKEHFYEEFNIILNEPSEIVDNNNSNNNFLFSF